MIFTPGSPWNVPHGALPHPDSARWITQLAAESTYGYMRLSLSSAYTIPVYYPKPSDPSYVVSPPLYGRSVTMRIPKGATPASGTDGALITIDFDRNECFSLWRATYSSGVWKAQGTARYDMASDGLCSTPGNFGHRGVPPTEMVIRGMELDTGEIPHVLEVFIPNTSSAWVWPLCGGEQRSGLVPEGMFLRLKQDVDLTKFKLKPRALIIARTAQKYGLVVGDTDPNVATIKCDRALVGSGMLPSDLATLPWKFWEFVQIYK